MSDFETYEDYVSEARILSDAELIKDGAHIRLGRLVISEYQYEKARLVHDPVFNVARDMGFEGGAEYSDLGLEATNSHPELDKDAAEVWQQTFPQESTKVPNALKRNNIASIRDLLVIGREKTATIRGLGPTTIELIAHMLEGETPISWEDKPTVRDIAEFCDTIDQISELAVRPEVLEGKPWHLSIGQVLSFPPDEHVNAFDGGGFSSSGYLQERRPKEIYAAAEVFALQFDEAKHGVWTDPAQFD